jgi:hypothetical protein
VVMLAAVTLVITKSWPSYSSFLVGAPVFVLPETKTTEGSQLGTMAVQKGTYYALSVQSRAEDPFQIFFAFPNGEKSKVLIVDPRLVGPNRAFQSVIKAERDDPAAQITTGHQSGPGGEEIQLRQVSVSQLNPRLYLWRTAIRDLAMLALLGACLFLAWRGLRGRGAGDGMATSPAEGDAVVKPRWGAAFWTSRRAGVWAVCLLVAGAGFDGLFLESEHSHLVTIPFHSSITGWDGSFYYFWLRSVMVDGDIDFTNDLLYCNSMPPEYRHFLVDTLPRTQTGLIADKYPVGWALLEVPWYIAADLTAQFINWRGGKLPYDGWGPVYQLFLVFGQVVYATASLYFSYKILQEYFPPAFAACGMVLGWLGSPIFFYQTLDVIMSHNVMFFAMTGAFYFCYRIRERPEKLWLWFWVGFLSAFVILARYQGVIMLLFPGVVCLQEVGRNFRRVTGLLVALVAGAVPLAVQMLAWKLMYGSYFLYTYQHETFSWRHPHLWEVLFSPYHGLFNWHPMMLIGFLGFLVWGVRSRRYAEAICFTLSLALAIYINAAWDVWWFGASFGSRAFETCTLFSMIGLGYLLVTVSQRAVAFQVTAAALLVVALWSMNLMWMSECGRLPFEKPVTWRERIDMSVDYWSHAFDPMPG